MMKYSIYCRVCLLLGLLFFFSACKDDDDDVKSDKATNQWIESTMRSYYLWYEDIPDKAKLNYNSTPETFFQSLLSNNDGKTRNGIQYHYSTIEKKKSATTRSYLGEEPSLGFEFQNWIIGTRYATNILYVLPGSPAEKQGLKRGDWIHKINGANVSNQNVSDLLGGKTVVLTVSDHYDNVSNAHTVELVPAKVEDNPVFLTKVYEDESTGNKKVGYMVYNHFTSGPGGDNDETYNNELRHRFAEFKAQGVEEFVLDLRYNGGGLVTSAQILAELLAPESALGNTFCYLKYNDIQSRTVTFNLDRKEENLNLSRLFVLTTSRTASASEAVINGLRPYYKVYLLGEKTEGKNVGSVTLTNDKYDYDLHPIVCRIFNAENESEYADGFSPSWEPKDNGDYRPIINHVELGDKENDKLLKAAIYWIRTDFAPPVTGFTRSSALDVVPGYCSLDRKAQNGMRVPY